jgi:hypothetical protein
MIHLNQLIRAAHNNVSNSRFKKCSWNIQYANLRPYSANESQRSHIVVKMKGHILLHLAFDERDVPGEIIKDKEMDKERANLRIRKTISLIRCHIRTKQEFTLTYSMTNTVVQLTWGPKSFKYSDPPFSNPA